VVSIFLVSFLGFLTDIGWLFTYSAQVSE